MKPNKTKLAENQEVSKTIIPTKKEQSPKLGGWLFNVKGTVAEPWPTAEELWEDPEVQEEIKKFEEAIKYLKNNKEQQG